MEDPKDGEYDFENDPVGDGYLGDGFSWYEEYRGFMVSKPDVRHVRLNPLKKNFFILNDAGLEWGRFESAFKYKVYEVNEEQVYLEHKATYNKVKIGYCWINFNNGLAHLNDQAGIKLFDGGAKGSTGLLGKMITKNGNKGPMGPPNIVYGAMVNVDRVKAVAKKKKINEESKLKMVVAHETGHGLNTYHHGKDEDEKYIRRRSGNMSCLMRYDNLNKKPKNGPRKIEPIGTVLCNAQNKNKNVDPKIGNCDKGFGDCEHQHRVNCKLPAPPAR